MRSASVDHGLLDSTVLVQASSQETRLGRGSCKKEERGCARYYIVPKRPLRRQEALKTGYLLQRSQYRRLLKLYMKFSEHLRCSLSPCRRLPATRLTRASMCSQPRHQQKVLGGHVAGDVAPVGIRLAAVGALSDAKPPVPPTTAWRHLEHCRPRSLRFRSP